MYYIFKRQSAPNETTSRDFDPDELYFLKAESDFVSEFLGEIGSSVGLGEMKSVVIRDSTVLLGLSKKSDHALLRGRNESLQAAVSQLS